MRRQRSWTRNVLVAAAIAAPIILAVAAVGAGKGEVAPAAKDWHQWRGPERNSVSAETAWLDTWPGGKPKVEWEANIGSGFSTVAIAKGRLYTMGNTGGKDTVWCLNAATGEKIWHKSYPCKAGQYLGPRSTPTVDGDYVHTISRQGDVYCRRAENGDVVWSKNIAKEIKAKLPSWGVAGSPLVVGDIVIYNVGTAGVGLNKKSGELIWQTGNAKSGYSSPVPFTAGGKRSVLIFAAKGLVCLDPANGQQLWTHPWRTRHDVSAADPVALGNKIFISSGYGAGCAMVEVTGRKPKELWRNRTLASHFSTAVVHEGMIYGVHGNTGRGRTRSIICLDPNKGRPKWTRNIPGMASLMLADGKLIVMIDGGTLAVIKAAPDGFQRISQAKVLSGQCWTMPVLAGGRIYCRNNTKGKLICLDVRKK